MFDKQDQLPESLVRETRSVPQLKGELRGCWEARCLSGHGCELC